MCGEWCEGMWGERCEGVWGSGVRLCVGGVRVCESMKVYAHQCGWGMRGAVTNTTLW